MIYKEIQENFDKVNQRVDKLEIKVDNLTIRVDKLDKKVDELTIRVNELDKKFDNLSTRVNELDKKFDNLSTRVNELDKKVNEITEILASIQRSVVLIEDYVTTRIPALFDAYSLNQDQHNVFSEEINNLDKLTERHSLQISILEDTSKTHSKQLENLA